MTSGERGVGGQADDEGMVRSADQVGAITVMQTMQSPRRCGTLRNHDQAL